MWLRLLYQYYKTEAFVCWYMLISIDAIEQFLLVLGDLCINFLWYITLQPMGADHR